MWFLLGTTLTASFFDSLNPSAIAKKIAAITPGSSACTDLRQLNVCNNLAIIDFESGERHT